MRTRRGEEALPEGREGQEALTESRDGSGGPPGWPGGLGSRREPHLEGHEVSGVFRRPSRWAVRVQRGCKRSGRPSGEL